jgi:nicotinamidase-related amidase
MITAIDKNMALVLIDLQKGIVKNYATQTVSEVLAHAAKLIDAFREQGLPIVIVNVNPMGAAWTKTRKEISTVPPNPVVQTVGKVAMSLSGFTDIVPEIKADAGDIFITKHTWNAFYETMLHEELQKRNVTGIVLGGIATSIGVEGTARAASERGYNVSFATDAMTDRVAEAHRNSIVTIFPRIGEVGSVDEIVEKLKSRG